MYKKNITPSIICQQENKIDFQKPLEQIIKSLSKTARMVLNLLLSWAARYKNIWPSQSTIAKMIGCTRQTVNEVCQILKEYDLITIFYHHRTSNSYKISPLFHNPFIRSRLMAFLPALKSLAIYMILSASPAKPDTIINKEFIISNSLLTDTTKKEVCSTTKRGVYGMSNFATINTHDIFKDDDFAERKKSDNAYYAQSHRLKNVNSTTKSQSPIQTETKNNHQGEISKPIPSEVSDGLRSIVSRKAVKYWKMGKTQYFVISKAEIFARDFPQAAADWYRYIATAEGKEFMRWVMAYSKKYWDPFSEKIIY